jgi:hypothetical protein
MKQRLHEDNVKRPFNVATNHAVGDANLKQAALNAWSVSLAGRAFRRRFAAPIHKRVIRHDPHKKHRARCQMAAGKVTDF